MGSEVFKFGGTCLKDQDTLVIVVDLIFNKIQDIEGNLLVTCSASSGITNKLYSFLEEDFSEENLDIFIDAIKNHHLSLLDDKMVPEVNSQLDQELDVFKKRYLGCYYLGSISPQAHDALITLGERLIIPILHYMLASLDLDVIVVSPETFLLTNGKFGDASVLLEESKHNLSLILPPTKSIVLVPGYYGVSKEGEITTLGRSGTDYTGAVLAHSVSACSYSIWKDVDGFMSADPRIVEKATIINHLNYEEVGKLAFFGATVIHKRVMDIMQSNAIPVSIRNIHDFAAITTIDSRSNQLNTKPIISIASLTNLIAIELHKYQNTEQDVLLSRIYTELEDKHVHYLRNTNFHTNISFLIKAEEMDLVSKILVSENLIPHKIEKNIGLVSILGSTDMSTLKLVLQQLEEKHLNPKEVILDNKTQLFHFIFEDKDIPLCVQTLHRLIE